MNLSDVLHLKYPYANFMSDIVLYDDGDGKIYIGQWNLTDPQPSQDEINQWMNDPELQQQYQANLNKITNQPIYKQLDLIDLKSIRALRTGDTNRLAEYEQQAISLRAQLK